MPSVDPKYNKYTIMHNPFAKKAEPEEADEDTDENQDKN